MDYSQNDPRWSNDFLGTSKVWKMGPAGCFVTALANVARALGHDITPGELNRQLTAKGLINSEGDIIRDNVLTAIFPDIEYVETKNWTTTDADLSYFDVSNDLSTELVVMVDYSPNSGLQTHFMRAIGRNGNDVTVDDSWDGVRKGVSAYCYGRRPADIIYKAIKYRKQAINTPQGGDEDMIKAEDRDLLRKLTLRLKLWDEPIDIDKEMKAWTGQDLRKFLSEGMNETADRFGKLKSAAQQATDLAETNRTLTTANGKLAIDLDQLKLNSTLQIKNLQEQLAEATGKPVYVENPETGKKLDAIMKMLLSIKGMIANLFKRK